MTRLWKWPAAVLGLIVGGALLLGYSYLLVRVGLSSTTIDLSVLFFIGPVIADVAILVTAVSLSLGSKSLGWAVVRNLLLGVWISNILTFTSIAVLAAKGLWPLF
jgi:hypothetical protein